MKNIKLLSKVANNKKVVLVILFFVLILIVLFFSYNKNTDNITIDNVSLNNINNKSKLFAIMISENNGSDYHECSSEICNNSSFPNSAYIYQKSVCLDDRGETANDAIVTYQNNQAKVTSNKTVYCTLYFNKDTTKPTITNFYIKGNTGQPKYSNNTNKQETATVTWSDNDVVSYCIINTNNVTNCDSNSNWKTTNSNSATLPLTLSEGSNTYYAFLKDIAGNTSALDNNQASKSDTIVLDTKPPVITVNATNGTRATDITETSANIIVVASDTNNNLEVSGVKQYCYSKPNEDSGYKCENYSTNVKISLTKLQPGTSYTYRIYAIDNAGNSGTKVQIPFTTNQKVGGDYVDSKVVGENVGDGGYASTGVVNDPLVKRFYGEDPNNYICFGADTCENNGDNMYRIIGTTSDGELKIIKQTKLANDITWTRYISDYYFYDNEDLVPSTWKQYIEQNPTWCTTKYCPSTPYTGAAALGNEMEKCEATGQRVGLMYISDYYFAYDGTGTRDCSSSYAICDSWLSYDQWEWTMTGGYSTFSEYSYAFIAIRGSYVFSTSVEYQAQYGSHTEAVRPVFYLVSNIKLSGNGKVDDPFIITGLA